MTNNIFFKPEMFTDLYQCKKKNKPKSKSVKQTQWSKISKIKSVMIQFGLNSLYFFMAYV